MFLKSAVAMKIVDSLLLVTTALLQACCDKLFLYLHLFGTWILYKHPVEAVRRTCRIARIVGHRYRTPPGFEVEIRLVVAISYDSSSFLTRPRLLTERRGEQDAKKWKSAWYVTTVLAFADRSPAESSLSIGSSRPIGLTRRSACRAHGWKDTYMVWSSMTFRLWIASQPATPQIRQAGRHT